MSPSSAALADTTSLTSPPPSGSRGILERQPLNSLAAILSGALTEACMLVANAVDPSTARTEAIAIIERLLQGLRVQSEPASDG